MKLRSSVRLSLAVFSLAWLASCTASTELTNSWTDPTAANRSFKKIAVVGVTPKTSARRIYEDTFAQELQSRGITPVTSYSFAGEGQLDKDAAVAKLKELGVDAVIVTRLIDQETYQTYYPPTYSAVAAPSAYYGGWYGYYSMGYSYMSTPGYTEENKVFRLETNLYDVTNDKLAWSGLTQTTISAGEAPETQIKPFIDTIVMDMEKHKVVPRRK
ncbi:MAG TPA: hypothetical protein VFQ05_03605 [Candidatus Eisenbacteria bacterium]|nr:hypothetical protein [Candidatus Eisenbacteria bacterium]